MDGVRDGWAERGEGAEVVEFQDEEMDCLPDRGERPTWVKSKVQQNGTEGVMQATGKIQVHQSRLRVAGLDPHKSLQLLPGPASETHRDKPLRYLQQISTVSREYRRNLMTTAYISAM